MPIVVDRRTGKIISAPEYTQEQKDAAWEMIVRNWIQRHADEFRELCVSTDNTMKKGDNLQAEN